MFIITSRQTNTKKITQYKIIAQFVLFTRRSRTLQPYPPPNAIAGKRHSVQFGFTSAPAGANRAIPPVSFAALAPRSHVFILTDVKLEHQRVKLCNGQRAAAPKTAHTHTPAKKTVPYVFIYYAVRSRSPKLSVQKVAVAVAGFSTANICPKTLTQFEGGCPGLPSKSNVRRVRVHVLAHAIQPEPKPKSLLSLPVVDARECVREESRSCAPGRNAAGPSRLYSLNRKMCRGDKVAAHPHTHTHTRSHI